MLRQPIILKNVTVNEFNGNCGLTYNSLSKIIPSDGREVIQNLANWYANERNTMEIVVPKFKGINYDKNISIHTAISLNKNNRDTNGRYFNIAARISTIKNLVYRSCIKHDCKKKVEPKDGQYYCPKCDEQSNTFKYSFMVNVKISDHSGSHSATIFGKTAEKLLGKTANEVGQIIETHGELDGINIITQKIINKLHNFNIKTSIDVYNDSEYFKWTIVDLKPFNLAKYAEHLASVFNEATQLCNTLRS